MTTATQTPRNGRPQATDEWLGGAAEPPAEGGQARTTPAARALAKGPVVPPYRPTTRKPLAGARWPFILVEGGEYSGKTTHAFKLAAAEDTWSAVYVLPIGEDVDEFGEIADFEILEHDGSWHQIIGCVDYVAEKARAANEANDKPVLFIVDSMTKVWKLLSEWAENRARSAPSNRAKLQADPNDEPDIGTTFWNASNKRHDRLVTKLITMPAVVVSTARGKWVTEMDAAGKPTKNKVYTVEAQRSLGFSTTAMIRLEVGKYPMITGLRRVRGGIQPGLNQAVTVDPRTERFKDVEFNLDWLLRHVLKFDPAKARTATTVEPKAGAEPDEPPAAARQAPPAPADADEAPGRAIPSETVPAATR